MDPLRRGIRSFRDRYPKTFLALGVLGFAAFTLWDFTRVWRSPIRDTRTFYLATAIGAGFGVVSALPWIVTVYRERSRAKGSWWQWTTAALWLIAIFITHPMVHHQPVPPVSNWYMVGALWYEILAFVGTAAALAVALTRRRVRA